MTKRILFKERAILNEIRENYPTLDIVHNKQISACSKKRPDILIDLGVLVIVIEIDENAHETYDPACEDARLVAMRCL